MKIRIVKNRNRIYLQRKFGLFDEWKFIDGLCGKIEFDTIAKAKIEGKRLLKSHIESEKNNKIKVIGEIEI
jgi:hypothetical protein